MRFLSNALRGRAAGSSIEVVRAWPEDCGNRAACCRFRRGCGGPDKSLGLGLLLGSNSEAWNGSLEGECIEERGASEWSATGRWTCRACNWRGQSGADVACGNIVEDEENDAIDVVREKVREGDAAGVLELEDADAMLGGL